MRLQGLNVEVMSSLMMAVLLLLLPASVSAQECTSDGRCDKHERCQHWATVDNECILNRLYMQKHCPAQCKSTQTELKVARAAMEAKGEKCADFHKHCEKWRDLGECETNKADMNTWCKRACGICTPSQEELDEESCKDTHENCKFWADAGECQANPKYMHTNCAKSCDTCVRRTEAVVDAKPGEATPHTNLQTLSKAFGTVQSVEGARAEEVAVQIQQSIDYLTTDQYQSLPEDIRTNCLNRHELCSFWKVIGECENNKAYMKTNCAPACMSCHLIDMEQRCPKLVDPDPALVPGDLNKMFERIVRQAPGNRTLSVLDEEELAETGTPHYTVHVHSRPDAGATEISAALDKSMPPWVITFDNFLTDEECDTMIQLGYKYEYKRSEDVGAKKFDGTHDSIKSNKRTSENAWCSTFAGCRAEDVPQRLHNRMGRVMGISPENSEDLQLLKYEVGQYYKTHHDYIPHQVDRQCGPRILTFFLYLSDVEEGGGTNFPQLDLTIEPKRGRALLWPSVLNSEPMSKDTRTFHQALSVEKGLKFAANGWIHMYDYQKPQLDGCN